MLASRRAASRTSSACFHLAIAVLSRIVPTRLAIFLLKRLRIDVRRCWEFERLYFLNRAASSARRMSWLRLYGAFTPVGLGLAWGCAMESAFRVLNLAHFQNANSDIRRRDREYCLRMLRKERDFIAANPEISSNNNHYFLNIIGMLVANEILADEAAKSADSHLRAELSRLCGEQFLVDGGNFEGSTNYHFLVLEALAVLLSFAPRLRDIVEGGMNLQGALGFAGRCSISSDEIWLVGDNDDSACIKRPGGQLRYDQLQWIGKHLGDIREYSSTSEGEFPDFGAFFGSDGDLRWALWCPVPGQAGKCGHNHNDKLSLTLALDGKAILTDPGVYLYSARRNEFRSAVSHGCLRIEGAEHEMFLGGFRMTGAGHCTVDGEGAGATGSFVTDAYSLRRALRPAYDAKCLHVHDSVQRNGKTGSLIASLVLAPEVLVIERASHCLKLSMQGRMVNIDLLSLGAALSVRTGWVARGYGQMIEADFIDIISADDSVEWRISYQ